MNGKRGVLILSGCLLLLALAVSGCGAIAEKATETAIEQSTGVKIDKDGEQVTIEGEDGAVGAVGEDVKLPDDFPADVPVYEGEIKAVIAGENQWTVSLETPDDAQTVLDFYAEKLAADGWKKEMTANTPDGGMYSASKGERAVSVAVSSGSGEDAGKTVVTMSASGK